MTDQHIRDRTESLSNAPLLSPFFLEYLPALSKVWVDQPNVVLQWTNLQVRIPHRKHQTTNQHTTSSDTTDAPTVNRPETISSFLASIPGKVLTACREASSTTTSILESSEHDRSKEFTYALQDQSGLVYPGRLVFVLGGAASGKSTLLHCLSGHAFLTSQRRHFPPEFISGQVTYNGLTAVETKAKYGFHVTKYTNLVHQDDVHFSYLTVRETLAFVAENANADIDLLGDACTPELKLMHHQRVDMIIKLLGLTECADTLVGNGSVLLRGLSGGQRRRLTLAESLLSGSRILCLDQATDGLDTAVAYQLLVALKQYCRLAGITVITTLLQPSMDLFELADDVIVLREGAVLYHGPALSSSIRSYFWSIQWPIPLDTPILDFLNMVMSEPKAAALRVLSEQRIRRRSSIVRGMSQSEDARLYPNRSNPSDLDLLARMPQTTDQLAEAFRTSAAAKTLLTYDDTKNIMSSSSHRSGLVVMAEQSENANVSSEKSVADVLPVFVSPLEVSPYTRAQYYSLHPRTSSVHISLCLQRQLKLFRRNWLFFIPRMGQAVFVGTLLGLLYYQLVLDHFQDKFMLMLFIPVFLAFANISELPWASEALQIVYKHIDNRAYEAWHYLLAVVAIHSILILLETVVFGSLVYWLAGLYARIDLVLIFLLILVGCNYTMSGVFRIIAFSSPNADAAQQIAAPVTAIALLFGGLLITKGQIPRYLLEFFWLSPFSWVVRAIASSEMHSPAYTVTQPDGTSLEIGPLLLSIFQIDDWVTQFGKTLNVLLTLLYLFGIFGLLVLATVRVLMRLRVGGRLPTERIEDATITGGSLKMDIPLEMTLRPSSSSTTTSVVVGSTTLPDVVQISVPNSKSLLQDLSFHPTSVVFQDLSYFLRGSEVSRLERWLGGSGGRKATKDRYLLHGLNGTFAPGTLTALMGESGAGKTTLLNVLADRISGANGVVTGNICFGGIPLEDHKPGSLRFGYVEQYNLLLPYQTIREAIRFSAELRLQKVERDVMDLDRFVDEILELVSLTAVADCMISNSSHMMISVGQVKRCCIGIELAANPTILFCDEPTTGLDDQSALAVLLALKRVSQTGRTVVCTIHQPSEELFEKFDKLYLLQAGGECVYYGDIGSVMIDDESVNPHLTSDNSFALDAAVDSSDVMMSYRIYPGHSVLSYFIQVTNNQLASSFDHAKRHIGEWMLHNLALTQQRGDGVNYAKLYRDSPLGQQNIKLVRESLEASRASVDFERKEKELKPTNLSCVQASREQLHTFQCVFRRIWTYYNRDVTFHLIRWCLSLLLSLFYGAVYYQVSSNSQSGVIAKISSQFMSMGFTAVLMCASGMPVTYKLRDIYYADTKRSSSAYYHPFHFTVVLSMIEIPFILVNSLLAILPFYFMVGLKNDFGSFLQYYLIDVLMSYQFISWGHVLTASIPNLMVANIVMGASFSLLFLFGGVPIRINSIPKGFQFLYHTFWLSKGVIATNVLQFECHQENPFDCGVVEVVNPLVVGGSAASPSTFIPQNLFVADVLGHEMVMSTYWWQFSMMIITAVALRLIAAIMFHKVHYQ